MRSLSILFVLALATAACDGGVIPLAPSPPSPPASTSPPQAPPSVTFTVRSGAEGLPLVPGATVRIGDVSRTTDARGAASFDGLTTPAVYQIDAPDFLSYRGWVGSSTEVVTLWPLQPGMTGRWIAGTSYDGPDYTSALWRPVRDVRLALQGVLANEPYRSVWDHAVRQVAGAIESGGSSGPTVRLDTGAGAVPVRLEERPTCEAVRWGIDQGILTPPPVMSISAEARARDPETVLDIVTSLVGFVIRREGSPHSGGTLSAIERTAIRMRMLRLPGTFFSGTLENTTVSEVEATSGYWCR